jgi:hypothetical protein
MHYQEGVFGNGICKVCSSEFVKKICNQIYCCAKCRDYFHYHERKQQVDWRNYRRKTDQKYVDANRIILREHWKQYMRMIRKNPERWELDLIRARDFTKYKNVEKKCIICGIDAQIHHISYNPSKVAFLCRKHHKALHTHKEGIPSELVERLEVRACVSQIGLKII